MEQPAGLKKSAAERKRTPLYAESMTGRGSYWGRREDGTEISGGSYHVAGSDYVLTVEEGGKPKVFWLNHAQDLPEISNPAIVREIFAVVKKNHEIQQARIQRAAELAGGNELLAEILLWNMNYRDGEIDTPIKKAGVDFYPVGRNATHDFYAGTKGGNRYEYVSADDWDDEKGEPKLYESVRKVKAWGYMGH
jgi:hypothetical protein